MAKGENEVIYDQYGYNGFVKVKAAWDLKKVLFSFVNKSSENKDNIDCYMRCGRIWALVEDFDKGEIDKKLRASIKNMEENNSDYAESVWESTYGGREDKRGNCFSRYFTIAPGMKGKNGHYNYAVMTAFEKPAVKNRLGGYEPKKGAKATLIIRVPFTQREDFREMITEIRFAVKSFYWWRYSYENTLSTFAKSQMQSEIQSERSGLSDAHDQAEYKKQTCTAEEKNNSSDEEVAENKKHSDKEEKKDTKEDKVKEALDQKLESDILKISVRSKTPVTERTNGSGDFSMQVLNEKDETLNLVIPKKLIDSLTAHVWSKFVLNCTKTSEKPVQFTMECTKGMEANRTVYYMIGFASNN